MSVFGDHDRPFSAITTSRFRRSRCRGFGDHDRAWPV